MSVLTKTLKQLKKEKTLVDVWRDLLTDESLTGVVTDFNDEFVYMSLVSDDGFDNGISVFYRAAITRIRWGGNVRDCIAELASAKNLKLQQPKLKLDSLEEIIYSVNKEFGHVNLQTERMQDDICFIGKVLEIDKESVLLQEFGTKQTRSASTLLLDMNEITRIDAAAPYEKDIVFLAEQRKNKKLDSRLRGNDK